VHGRPQTFFQGISAKKNKKRQFFAKKSKKSFFWSAKAGLGGARAPFPSSLWPDAREFVI